MAEGELGENEGLVSLAADSEFVFDFYCDVCRDDGKHLEAAGFCVDCEEYLCGTCVSSHKRSRPSRYHKVLDDTDMPKDNTLSQDRKSKDIQMTCSVHNGESVKYYCKTHDGFGCRSCFVTGHTDCCGITPILLVAHQLLEDREVQSFMETLAGMRQKVIAIIEQAHGNVSHLEQCCIDAVREVKEFREEMNNVLDDLEKHFIEKVEDATAEEISAIETFESELQDVKAKIETISSEVDHLLQTRRVGQLFITMKKSVKKLDTLGKGLQSAEERVIQRSIRFKPSKPLRAFVKKMDAFGTVCVNHSATPSRNLNRDIWTGSPEREMGMSLEPIGRSGRGRKQRTRNKKHSYKTDLDLDN